MTSQRPGFIESRSIWRGREVDVSPRWRARQTRLEAQQHDGIATFDHATVLYVRSAVAALPPREREVVALRYFSDLSVREVAEIVERPEGTVKRLTNSAMTRLRAAFAEPAEQLG